MGQTLERPYQSHAAIVCVCVCVLPQSTCCWAWCVPWWCWRRAATSPRWDASDRGSTERALGSWTPRPPTSSSGNTGSTSYVTSRVTWQIPNRSSPPCPSRLHLYGSSASQPLTSQCRLITENWDDRLFLRGWCMNYYHTFCCSGRSSNDLNLHKQSGHCLCHLIA